MDDGDQMSAFHRSHSETLELPAYISAYQLCLKYLVSCTGTTKLYANDDGFLISFVQKTLVCLFTQKPH